MRRSVIDTAQRGVDHTRSIYQGPLSPGEPSGRSGLMSHVIGDTKLMIHIANDVRTIKKLLYGVDHRLVCIETTGVNRPEEASPGMADVILCLIGVIGGMVGCISCGMMWRLAKDK